MSFKDIYLFESNIASLFAQYKHRKQVRKFDGQPYYVHPREVAEIVWKYTKDFEMAKASMLHDTLEDTTISEAELRKYFSHDIVEAVKLLTKTKDIDYFDYLKKIKNNKLARTVKLADIAHNLSDKPVVLIHQKPPPACYKAFGRYRR